MRNFNIYPTVYQLGHLDKGFENRTKSSFCGHIETFRSFKLNFNPEESEKSVNMKKLRFFIIYSTVYHFHNSGKRLKKSM